MNPDGFVRKKMARQFTVWLVSPTGKRERIGVATRKSGVALLELMATPSVQERLKQFPDADELWACKMARSLELTNGWRIVFGKTVRMEERTSKGKQL